LPDLKFSSKTINAGTDAKTIKGNKVYLTAIMYMAPYLLSGVNLCPMAALAECHVGCLNTAGRGAFSNVTNARAKKADWFNNNRIGFLRQLDKDLTRFIKFCKKHGVKPAVRLNGTTDIRWELQKLEGFNMFEHYPMIQFYDYTKIYNRKCTKYKNYHLTWSYSEANPTYAKFLTKAIILDMNVAVVFRDKNFPKTFKGLEVVDGDKDDLRFLDKQGVVVGLSAKGKAKKDTSGFVIDP
jgi:hypothetical protein